MPVIVSEVDGLRGRRRSRPPRGGTRVLDVHGNGVKAAAAVHISDGDPAETGCWRGYAQVERRSGPWCANLGQEPETPGLRS